MINNNSINQTSFNCAALEFDLELGTVQNTHGEMQRLSPINLKLLTYFLNHQGDVISRTELFDAVWPNQIVSDDVLTRAISDIRTQLAKLDVSSKCIETLPKRGYRWVLEVSPVAAVPKVSGAAAPNTSDAFAKGVAESVVVDKSRTKHEPSRLFRSLLWYVLAASFLAAMIMWALSQLASQQFTLAVLPVVSDRPQTERIAKSIDANLLQLLRKNPRVKLLSQAALNARPQNPFPYFFKEFNAKWVLECRVSDLEGAYVVEMSLVDARTGLELRSLSLEAASLIELNAMLAKRIEWELLAEPLNY